MSKTEKGEKPANRHSTLKIIITLTVLIILGGGCAFYYAITFVHKMLPLAIAAGIAVVSGIWTVRYWTRITGTCNRYVNHGVNLFITGVTVLFIILATNYHCSPATTLHHETATVTGKHSEKRYHTRRIRGRYTGQGTPYHVYYVHLKFENGNTKQFDIPLKRYNRLKTGTTVPVDVKRGLWGWSVIDTPISATI